MYVQRNTNAALERDCHWTDIGALVPLDCGVAKSAAVDGLHQLLCCSLLAAPEDFIADGSFDKTGLSLNSRR